MKTNLLLSAASGLIAYFINVFIHGSWINAFGAFITAFVLCLVWFWVIDVVADYFRRR